MEKTKTSDKAGLPAWVFRNLSKYGNCAIAPWRLKMLGETKLREVLLSRGFDCTIREKEYPFEYKNTTKYELYVILEVRGLVA